ncbi:MAG: transcription-repair coupling factor [Acidobacteria bacterium RIFCSPLOWO2_02_FULL_61_28]|nr:MAG: transcription-repair coupling factor [Acidobacteria bacterium RIFCSPLOWO2_02_FULL_61_28]
MEHPVKGLLMEIAEAPEFREMVRALERRAPGRESSAPSVTVSGLTAAAKTLYAVLLRRALGKPLLYVARSNRDAEQVLDAMETWARWFGEPPPVWIPAHDIRPYQGLSPHADISEKRALGLGKLAAGQASLAVLPIGAAAARLESPEFYRSLARPVRRGDALALEDLLEHLETVGYLRHDPVEMVGQFSLRGGILDVYSPEARRPVRVELFGDEVETIREFDVNTQRSVGPLGSTLLLPLTEFPLRQDLLTELAARSSGSETEIFTPGEPFPGWEFQVPLLTPLSSTLLDLSEQAVLFFDEPQELRKEIERLWSLLEPEFAQAQRNGETCLSPDHFYLRWEELAALCAGRSVVNAEELALVHASSSATVSFDFATQPAPRFHGNLALCLAEIENRLREQYRVLLLTTGTGETDRLAELLAERRIPFQRAERPGLRSPGAGGQGSLSWEAIVPGDPAIPSCWIGQGAAPHGLIIPARLILILGNQDLFETSEAAARPVRPRSKISTFLSDFRDLRAGDYIVHVEHGIGCYRGLREIAHEGVPMEFMELEYQDAARLYVPLARLDLVQKYRGLEGSRPALDRLGGASWGRTKARVRKSMEEMAGELLKLYAERETASGTAFPGDDHWQQEFSAAFEYEETPDQQTAIEEVRRDMEKPAPMDRLICGDVGYGKTEVAMRAAFRVATHNRQAAVLTPTTVLAFQHYETFRGRFAAFPIRIEMLSRFRTAAQQKAVLRDLESGKVDIVIGTHRLLSKDVVFHDLGLVVVDEEQRFGVRHKERLKEMKKSVDVLSLSATPIPRTLHMGLVGLRNMSLIETPPRDRLAIQTTVAPFSEGIVKTAIEQELERGGQVYFVHNRVHSLPGIVARIQELVPHARIAMAHGQMNERQLERVMLGFLRHETNVLAATTIIENGLDIPLVNTIVVNRAERMGLSELYQLRGRVGRSNRRAYAYLLVSEEAELSPEARRRLSALKEFSELGSGFRVAALDMELRGAGNLLGRQQHGHVNAVGFELYCQMLERAVQELRGEETRPELAPTIQLGLDIRIPPSYIPEEHQRLRMYKVIGSLRAPEERTRAEQELEDRYGPLPPPVRNLLDYATLKSAAERMRIQSVERRNETLYIQFHPSAAVDTDRLMDFLGRHPGVQFSPSGSLRVPLRGTARGVLPQARAVLEQLQG